MEFIQVPSIIHLAHIERFRGTSNSFSCRNCTRLSGPILGYIDFSGVISGRSYNLILYQDINEGKRMLSEKYIMVNSHGFLVHLSAQRSGRLPSYLEADEMLNYKPEDTGKDCTDFTRWHKDFQVITLEFWQHLWLLVVMAILMDLDGYINNTSSRTQFKMQTEKIHCITCIFMKNARKHRFYGDLFPVNIKI